MPLPERALDPTEIALWGRHKRTSIMTWLCIALGTRGNKCHLLVTNIVSLFPCARDYDCTPGLLIHDDTLLPNQSGDSLFNGNHCQGQPSLLHMASDILKKASGTATLIPSIGKIQGLDSPQALHKRVASQQHKSIFGVADLIQIMYRPR